MSPLRAGLVLLTAAALSGGVAVPETITNSLGMTLVRIEPGSFLMGQAEGEWDEHPTHRVTITGAFHLGMTQVTNAQYEQFDPSHRALRGKLGVSSADEEAVVYVSWEDAVRFCRWLSEREGRRYRLPTEAEWEYACRAGTNSPYSTGDALPAEFDRNQVLSWFPDPDRKPQDAPPALTVGKTSPNPWGLQDMHGNVEEWCADWYGPYEAGDQTDPVGRADGDFRVTRGGSHSTEPANLRSAKRAGALPEDHSFVIGFRVALGEPPDTAPLPVPSRPLNAQDVSQAPASGTGPDMDAAHFVGPRRYVKIGPDANGPLFARHNHDPAVVECPNGDILAIWYTCRTEPGRELGIAASRLRRGSDEWEPASPFWDTPGRNDHAPALWRDENGRLYHFNGLSTAATWGNLATILRTSDDNGATWSRARLIKPEHGLRHMPVESVFRTREGVIVLPCDAVTGGNGGTAVQLSRDEGLTWDDPGEGKPAPSFSEGATGAWIAGIHAGVTQLSDGTLMALGRGNSINGRMPMSLSRDLGQTWEYHASEFPPIDGGQRLALLRLQEGPILLISFSGAWKAKVEDITPIALRDANGNEGQGRGMFAALSFDDGKTWPIKKLVTPGGPTREVRGAGTGMFTLDATHSEPAGYLSITQAANGVIHLISSALHYEFNLAWLKAPLARGTWCPL
jgi:sulfatase modifying factor 1